MRKNAPGRPQDSAQRVQYSAPRAGGHVWEQVAQPGKADREQPKWADGVEPAEPAASVDLVRHEGGSEEVPDGGRDAAR